MESNTKLFDAEQTKLFLEKPIVKYYGRDRWNNIIGVRILRPWELKKLLDAIPKKYHRIQFEFLFYTGMRYVEAQEIKHRPDLFDGYNIHLTPEFIRKPKCKIRDRNIKLNPMGKRVAEEYFELEKTLPQHWNSWRNNLRRWCELARIAPDYMSVKTTRKTWESYLVLTYKHLLDEIFLSQGHTELTALKHYVGLAFSSENKKNMHKYVAGWGD